MASRGIRGEENSATSRLSGPAAKRGIPGDGEAGAEDHLHLPDAADAEHAEDAVQHDIGLGFLPGLARRALFQRLAVLQVTGGQGPETAARLDGAAAHQYAVVGNDDGADDDLGVVIGDMAAIGADQALAIVTVRNPADEVRHARNVTLSRRRINPRLR